MVQDSTVVMDAATDSLQMAMDQAMEAYSSSPEAQEAMGGGLGLGGILAIIAGYLVFILVLAVFMMIVQWKLHTKAGQPGWVQFIPIYGQIMFLKMIGRPWWWLLLCMLIIPAIILMFMIPFDLAKSFGKSTNFGFGLLLLAPIFCAILAFGDAKYVGPRGVPKAA